MFAIVKVQADGWEIKKVLAVGTKFYKTAKGAKNAITRMGLESRRDVLGHVKLDGEYWTIAEVSQQSQDGYWLHLNWKSKFFVKYDEMEGCNG
jgi:hypothetical protein